MLLRLDGGTVQALGPFPDLDPASGPHRTTFSSPDVLWSTGFDMDGTAVLTRSDDVGSTWSVVATLPRELRGAIDLHVDSGSTGVLTAWVAMAGIDSAATPGPRIFSRSLEDGGGGWQQIPGIPETPFLGSDGLGAWLGRRAGAIELLRRSAGAVALEVLTGGRETVSIAGFSPLEYTTFGDRGWAAGVIRTSQSDTLPAVLTIIPAGGGIEPEPRPIAGLDNGQALTIDFRDEMHGFVCGVTDAGTPFCAYSDDGGAAWTLGDVLLDPPAATITSVVRTGCGTGFATWRTPYSFQEGLLETRDGGRTWRRVALPELAPELIFGRLARSSSAVDDGAQPRPGPTGLPPAPTPAPPPLAGDEPGPLVWLVGEVERNTPAVTGTVLRSTDGGASWTEVLDVPGGALVDTDFVDREIGRVVGGRRILRTTDGGTSFVEQAANVAISEPVLRVDLVRAVDREHALIKVATGTGEFPEIDTLLVTSDGGARWEAAHVPPWPFDRALSDVCLITHRPRLAGARHAHLPVGRLRSELARGTDVCVRDGDGLRRRVSRSARRVHR
ncbi:MAG: hypothetical protein AB1689_13810 [Thermodesulfobacteriota bacterium]